MAKYIITVHEIFPPTSATEVATGSTQEIFKLGIDEFDPVALCAALSKRARRPRKSTTAPTGK